MRTDRFLFFSFVCAVSAYQVTYPLDNDVLGNSCTQTNGKEGVYKMSADCKSVHEISGFIKFAGAVVCCSRNSNMNAKTFCSKHGAEVQSLLDFHISEGEEADVSEFPHMAAIGYETIDQETVFDCGGSLISENFVITAAHCCTDKRRVPTTVRLGRVR